MHTTVHTHKDTQTCVEHTHTHSLLEVNISWHDKSVLFWSQDSGVFVDRQGGMDLDFGAL